jgi:hypothetical protein
MVHCATPDVGHPVHAKVVSMSRRRERYHSMDQAQFPKGKTHDTVANPELHDQNIQKAFITVDIVHVGIS